MAKRSLLLVDGDARSLRVLEVSLRKAGFVITTAINGRDALDKARTARPDLILSDTDMPEMDGFELCREVKADPELSRVPFVFLTGETAIESKIRGLELGVDEYLTKPIYIKEILTRIRILLQKQQRASLETRRDANTRFAGTLHDMGVLDLIQTIEVSRKSGLIHFSASDGRQATIYFRSGVLIDAETGHLQGEDAVYRLLTWSEGEFELLFRTVRRKDAIETATPALLMEGMRRLDEWGRLLEQLPALSSRFEVDVNELSERLSELPDELNHILRLFDGRRSLLDVIDLAAVGDLECLELVSRLYFEGLLHEVEVPPGETAEMSTDLALEGWLGQQIEPAEGAPALEPAPGEITAEAEAEWDASDLEAAAEMVWPSQRGGADLIIGAEPPAARSGVVTSSILAEAAPDEPDAEQPGNGLALGRVNLVRRSLGLSESAARAESEAGDEPPVAGISAVDEPTPVDLPFPVALDEPSAAADREARPSSLEDAVRESSEARLAPESPEPVSGLEGAVESAAPEPAAPESEDDEPVDVEPRPTEPDIESVSGLAPGSPMAADPAELEQAAEPAGMLGQVAEPELAATAESEPSAESDLDVESEPTAELAPVGSAPIAEPASALDVAAADLAPDATEGGLESALDREASAGAESNLEADDDFGGVTPASESAPDALFEQATHAEPASEVAESVDAPAVADTDRESPGPDSANRSRALRVTGPALRPLEANAVLVRDSVVESARTIPAPSGSGPLTAWESARRDSSAPGSVTGRQQAAGSDRVLGSASVWEGAGTESASEMTGTSASEAHGAPASGRAQRISGAYSILRSGRGTGGAGGEPGSSWGPETESESRPGWGSGWGSGAGWGPGSASGLQPETDSRPARLDGAAGDPSLMTDWDSESVTDSGPLSGLDPDVSDQESLSESLSDSDPELPEDPELLEESSESLSDSESTTDPGALPRWDAGSATGAELGADPDSIDPESVADLEADPASIDGPSDPVDAPSQALPAAAAAAAAFSMATSCGDERLEGIYEEEFGGNAITDFDTSDLTPLPTPVPLGDERSNPRIKSSRGAEVATVSGEVASASPSRSGGGPEAGIAAIASWRDEPQNGARRNGGAESGGPGNGRPRTVELDAELSAAAEVVDVSPPRLRAVVAPLQQETRGKRRVRSVRIPIETDPPAPARADERTDPFLRRSPTRVSAMIRVAAGRAFARTLTVTVSAAVLVGACFGLFFWWLGARSDSPSDSASSRAPAVAASAERPPNASGASEVATSGPPSAPLVATGGTEPPASPTASSGEASPKENGDPAEPTSYELLYDEAKRARRRRDYQDVLSLTSRALQHKQTVQALTLQAEAFMAMEQPRAALRPAVSATELRPRYAPAWYIRGRIHRALGERDRARAAFEEYLEIEPDGGRADQVIDLLQDM